MHSEDQNSIVFSIHFSSPHVETVRVDIKVPTIEVAGKPAQRIAHALRDIVARDYVKLMGRSREVKASVSEEDRKLIGTSTRHFILKSNTLKPGYPYDGYLPPEYNGLLEKLDAQDVDYQPRAENALQKIEHPEPVVITVSAPAGIRSITVSFA